MKELVAKYLQDQLSREELAELRQYLSEASDTELADCLQALWEGYEHEEEVSQEDVLRLKVAIDAQLAPAVDPKPAARAEGYLWQRRGLWAVAVVLPVLLLLNVYQWWRGSSYEPGSVTMATEYRERSRVTLPDGSVVRLNEHSRLVYNPENFRSGLRALHFEGEAYFDIAGDSIRPFVLHQGRLEIKVLGTRFNLRAIGAEPYVRIDLDEGRVALEVEGRREPVYLSPREYAIYDKASNTIEVKASQRPGAASAWMQDELVFADTPLSTVLSTIEQRYGIQLEYDTGGSNALFTGTLPGNDLQEALEIVRRAMRLPIKVKQ